MEPGTCIFTLDTSYEDLADGIANILKTEFEH